MGKKIIKKNHLLILILVVVLLGGGSVGYYYYNQRVNSNSYFLQILSDYEQLPPETFKKNWPKIISKAKTSVHYLMLLKRLDQYQLEEEYKNTLVRALWKYPKMHGFLALTIEYTLKTGEHTLFQNALKNKDELWNTYPNLLRLYYIDEYERLGTRYAIDEILLIYYKIKEHRDTWNTWYTLWTLTNQKEAIFLYLAGIKALIEKDILTSQRLYKSLPLEWKNIFSNHYIQYAWLIKDVDKLRPIVESEKNITQYVKLAGLYILLDNLPEAYALLSNYKALFPEEQLTTQFVELYIWLEQSLYKNQNIIEYGEEILALEDIDLYIKYLSALYNIDVSLAKKYYDSSEGEFFNNEIKFNDYVNLIITNTQTVSNETIVSILWKMLNKYETIDRDYLQWIKIATAYFLSHDMVEDYFLLENRLDDNYQAVFFPYHFYFSITRNKLNEFELLQKKIVNYSNVDYEWWYYYNLGLWKINLNEYLQAEDYLLYAASKIDSFTQEYNYLILSQLVRLYLYKNEMDQAKLYFDKLISLFPTNPYNDELTRMLITYEHNENSDTNPLSNSENSSSAQEKK